MGEESRYFYKEYLDTHDVYCNRRLRTIKELINEFPIIEECIGFQFWLDDEIAKVINAEEGKLRILLEKNPKAIKQLVVGFSLYRRNFQYLYSAFELACTGLCEPAYNILRTVHESILALWYVTTHQDESEDILEYMRNNNATKTKYNHNHFLQSLYSGDIKEGMKKVYSGLSVKAHSNIFGMDNTEQYNIKQIKDCFWSIRLQSFYNIVSNIENLVQEPTIKKIILTPDVISFIERLKNEIGGIDKQIGNYFPNKNDIGKNFVLYNPT